MKRIINFAIIILLISFINITEAQVLNWYQTNGPNGIEKTRGFANDTSNNLYLITDRFIYKSSDSAKSWQQLNIFDQTLSSISIDKNNNIMLSANDENAYISSDQGSTWNKLTGYEDIKKDSQNGLYKTQNNRIFYSHDLGITWTDITPAIATSARINFLDIYGHDYILCSASYSDTYGSTAGGIYLSKDYGKTWDKFFEGSSCSILHISNSNQIYADINKSVFFTNDPYSIWNKLFDFLYYAQVMTNEMGTYIYLCDSNSRILYSDDNNITWKTVIQFNAVVELKFYAWKDMILIGYYDRNGIYKTTDLGNTWNINKKDFIGLTANSIIKNGNKIYCTTSYGLYKTEDYGNEWEFLGLENVDLNCSSISANGCLYVGALYLGDGIFSTSDDNTFIKRKNGTYTALKCIDTNIVLAASGNNLEGNFFRSTDGGNSWATLSNAGGYNQIIVDKNNRIYCPNRAFIVYSDDNGATWKKTNFNVWRATSLAINSKGEIFAGTFEGIYKSSDRGSTWDKIYVPQNVSLIDYLFIDSKDNVYFIEDSRGSGLLYQNIYDNGPSWKLLNGEFNNLGVSSIEEDSQGHLLVGTINGGVFRSKEQVTTSINQIEGIPSEYKLFQNYPNPFNPITIIDYAISKNSLVTIIIYDLLGRQVATLVNENKNSGEYSVVFDASKLASGVYFCQMKVDGFTETKKMILLR